MITDIVTSRSLIQVVMTDLVLAGDNAVVIGLAAAGLPSEQRNRAILVGILAATDRRIARPPRRRSDSRIAIGAMWKSLAEQVSDPKLTESRYQAIGTFCGARDQHLRPEGQEPNTKEVTGKYIVVWENAGRQRKLATDIWNADNRHH